MKRVIQPEGEALMTGMLLRKDEAQNLLMWET
jgi:hypothetical protein